MNKKHIGSDFDDFLKEEKLLKKTKIVTINRLSKHMKSEYNFGKGKCGAIVRAPKGKTRITIRLDDDVLEWFRSQVEESGGNYQTLINNALREYIQQQEEPIEVILRRVVREELQSASQ